MSDNEHAPKEGDQPSSFYKKVSLYGKGAATATPVEASKRRVFLALIFSMGILQTLYMNLAAFYPTHALKYYGIGSFESGIVLAMFQVAYLILSPIVGMNLQRIGRKNCIIIGYCFCIVATLGFSISAYLPGEQETLFLVISILIRFMQGVGDSMVATSSYSIVSIEFPFDREKRIGYCQTAVGLGLLAGPFMGQTIYSVVGYHGTFYILAGILTCSVIAASFSIPNRINHYASSLPNEAILDQKVNHISVQGAPIHNIAQKHSVDIVGVARVSTRYSRKSHIMEKQITYKMFLTNSRAMTAIVASMFAMIFMLFYEPTYTPWLQTHFGMSENVTGYVLGIGCFTYAFASPLVGMLCARVRRVYITLFAFLLCSVSLFMLGPSYYLDFPDEVGLSLAGIGMLGFSVAFLFVPLLPEIIASVSEKEGIEQSPFLSDKASGIYNCAYGIGNCLAPIIGGYMAQVIQFRRTCDVMAFCSAGFFVIYLVFAAIPAYLIQKKKVRKAEESAEQALINQLAPGSVDNSMTMSFDNKMPGALNDSTAKSGFGQ